MPPLALQPRPSPHHPRAPLCIQSRPPGAPVPSSVHPRPGARTGQPDTSLSWGIAPPVSSHAWVSCLLPLEGGVPHPEPRARAPSPESLVGHMGSSSEDRGQ